MSQVILAEYGRAKTLSFDLYEVDGVDLAANETDGGSDCSVRLDEAAEGTCTNDFADEGVTYSLILTAAEMVAARVTVTIVDAATKQWLDKVIIIETYGHPSSQHPWMTKYWTNGAVNDGSASSTVWTFDGFTEATADHVIGSELTFTSGANAGQCRTVIDYTSTVLTVSPAFIAAPADNDEFVLEARPTTSADNVPAVDIAAILADTNELQGDDIPGTLGSPAGASISADLLVIDNFVDGIESDLANGTDGLGALKTLIDTVNTDLSNGTDGLGSLKTLIDGLNDLSAAQVNTEVDSAFTTQMADSIPADGTISTREQALYAILQLLSEFSITTDTLTVKKVDGSTTLMTLTLSDATNPTSITRAT